MFRTIKHLVLLCIISGITACGSSTTRPELPDNIGTDGVVTAAVEGVAWLRSWGTADLIINGSVRSGGARGGYIALALPPGDYQLDGLRQRIVGDAGYNFGGVSATRTTTTTLPVKRSFTVRRGEVTNLGLIVLLPDTNDAQNKRFIAQFVDNSSEMRYFLQKFYPQFFASLSNKNVTSAGGQYASGEALQSLRRYIVGAKDAYTTETSDFVSGPAGTLAKVQRGTDGRIRSMQLLNVATLARVDNDAEQDQYQRYASITSDGRLYILSRGMLIQKALPTGIGDPRVQLFGEHGVVLIDDKFGIHTSTNDGDTWSSFTGAVLSETGARSLAEGVRGFYITNTSPPKILYTDFGKTDYRALDLPKEVSFVWKAHERAGNLFVETGPGIMWTHNSKQPFFVRAPNGNWEKRFLPHAGCEPLQFLDTTGSKLAITCNRERFSSTDGGLNWRKS